MWLLASTTKLFALGSCNLGMAGDLSGVACVNVRDHSLLLECFILRDIAQDYVAIIKVMVSGSQAR